jgi:glutamine synthetase
VSDARDALRGLGADRLRIELPDVNGLLRGKVVPAAKLASGGGAGFSDVIYCLTSADEVFENPAFTSNDTGWPDILAVPDWSTLRPVPWERGVAAVLCDATTKAGEPLGVDARAALRRACRRLADAGLEARCGVEYELFLFRADDAGAALREGRPRDLVPASRIPQAYSLMRWPDLADFAAALHHDLAAYGVAIEAMSTELGHGMFEVAIAPLPPLEAADAAARLKLGTKELARRHGLIATFMAKWDMTQSGSSGHVHLSLQRDGRNVMWDGQGALSPDGRAAIGGLAATAVETSAFMSPFPNSYRRYDPEMWTPVNVTWGHDNRNACLRVISLSETTTRVEHRRPGADLHPYASIAACLDGCLHGIAEGIEPPAEAPGRAAEAPGAAPFPTTLPDATAALEGSTLARAWYGDLFVDHYALSRHAEQHGWERARGVAVLSQDSQVPDWEACRYLEVL